jgi:hypothetical protein
MRYCFLVEESVVEITFWEIVWPERWGMDFDRERQDQSSRPPREGEINQLDPEREERVLRYILKVDPAISGQGGQSDLSAGQCASTRLCALTGTGNPVLACVQRVEVPTALECERD